MHQSDEAIGLSCRYKANLEKLGSGNLAKVAEVVSDLDVREREAGLSAGETHAGHSAADAVAVEWRVEATPTPV
jgi:RNA polymerase-interacting CarD/CdnL/TRCF family regulator